MTSRTTVAQFLCHAKTDGHEILNEIRSYAAAEKSILSMDLEGCDLWATDEPELHVLDTVLTFREPEAPWEWMKTPEQEILPLVDLLEHLQEAHVPFRDVYEHHPEINRFDVFQKRIRPDRHFQGSGFPLKRVISPPDVKKIRTLLMAFDDRHREKGGFLPGHPREHVGLSFPHPLGSGLVFWARTLEIRQDWANRILDTLPADDSLPDLADHVTDGIIFQAILKTEASDRFLNVLTDLDPSGSVHRGFKRTAVSGGHLIEWTSGSDAGETLAILALLARHDAQPIGLSVKGSKTGIAGTHTQGA